MAPQPASKKRALGAASLIVMTFFLGASMLVPSASAIQECWQPAYLDPGPVVGSLDFGERNFYVNYNSLPQTVRITVTDPGAFLNAEVQGAFCGSYLFSCTSALSVLSCYVPPGAALEVANNFGGTLQYAGVSTFG